MKLPTARQCEYLAFIAQYRALVEVSPSEGEMAKYFGVSGPSVHQMIVVLEANGFILRVPGAKRAVQLRVGNPLLPALGAPGEVARDHASGLASFALYLAHQFSSGPWWTFGSYGLIVRLAGRLEELLVELGAPRRLVKKGRKEVVRVGEEAFQRHRMRPEEKTQPRPAPERPRPKKAVPPEQGDLF